MPRALTPPSTTPSDHAVPFFELLAEATAIQVREVPSPVPPTERGERTPAAQRTFLVHVRSAPKPQDASAAPAESSGNRTYLLKSAELLVTDRDFVLARNIYSYLLRLNLRDVEALQGLGTCFLRLGEPTPAKKCFRALHEVSGRDDALLWLGQCFALEGDDESAMDTLSRVTQPANLKVHERFELFKELGNCHTRQGRFDQAWAAYHKALEADPSSDVIYVNLGTLETQRRHCDIASHYFQKALEINPKSSRARCGLGLLALVQNRPDDAEREFLRALDIDSQCQIALLQLSTIKGGSPNLSGELKARLIKFLQQDPRNADIRYALAILRFKESDWTGCERELSLLLSEAPGHVKAKQLRDELNRNRHLPA